MIQLHRITTRAIILLPDVVPIASTQHTKGKRRERIARRREKVLPPTDIQAIIEKHARTAALAQRQDIERLNTSALGPLHDKGMIVNEADTRGFRKPLGAFYARWKNVYGENAWALLEARVGRFV